MGAINYIWDDENDSLLEEVDDDGNVIASYTNEPGQFGKVISQERNGVTSYYHYDGQGSTVALTDDNQNITDTYIYSAFGELVSSTGTTVNPFRYVGQYGYYTDVETNDIYIRARSYNPSLGRWLSRDPIGSKGGDNSYSYVLGWVMIAVDPSGLDGFPLGPWVGGQQYPYLLPGQSIPGHPHNPPPPSPWPVWPVKLPPFGLPVPPKPPTIGGYGHYCGPARKATCTKNADGSYAPSPGQPPPIDDMDKACMQHDCCLFGPPEVIAALACRSPCNIGLCDALDGFECNAEYYNDPLQSYYCDRMKQQAQSLFHCP